MVIYKRYDLSKLDEINYFRGENISTQRQLASFFFHIHVPKTKDSGFVVT